MNSKKTLKNFLYSILSQAITICLGLAIPRFVIVGYGSEVNGLLNSVSQFIVYLSLLEAGVHAVALQALYKPISTNDRQSINGILSAVHSNYRKTGILYLCVLLFLAIVYPFFIGDGFDFWTVFAIVLFSGLGNVVLFFFQGKYKILLQAEGKNYLLTNVQTIISSLNSTAKIICLWLGLNVVIVVLISFLVSLLQAVYIHCLIKRKYRWIDLNVRTDERVLVQKNSALVHQFAGMVFQNTDILLLTIFCDLRLVSVYSMYKIATTHISALLTNCYNSFSFALGQMFNTDKKTYGEYINAVDVYFGGVAFAVYAVVYVLFVPFIELYTQGVTDIQYADETLCICFVGIELLMFSRMPQLQTINYAGRFKETLPQTIVETTLNLLVSLLTIRHLGIYGVLLGTMIALLYRTVDVWLYANVRILQRKARKTFLIYAIDLLLFILLVNIFEPLKIKAVSVSAFCLNGMLLLPTALLVYTSILSICFPRERKLFLEKIKHLSFKTQVK